MDKLVSQKDKLPLWLSSDPDYILRQCGDILSMNEYFGVQTQGSPLDKMKALVKIIMQKEGGAPQRFLDILLQHQARYQQLQQFFNSNTEGSSKPTVFANSGSVVDVRELTNVKGKSLNAKIETITGAGSRLTGNAAGQVPQADFTACDGSVICAGKMTNVEVDGDINLSINVKPSQQILPGKLDETPPYSQGPAVETVTEHKVELIDCLRADHSFILQHVHAKHIVTDRQYQNLKHISQPEQTVTNLIDQVIMNGQNSCSLFLDVLNEPDIVTTYPQLREITQKMVLSNSGTSV
ncbi:uncharacterized protein LOC121948634 [Plectropomus leopardus]|uniref:uncharacterized protein LOC121948634 n=1 Tax=Plectropomus leopardus TaxID=160734 RepID=UPI001C4A88FC|nr:uncharacterized protein LOC121948634 [Plectropomus leopardus]